MRWLLIIVSVILIEIFIIFHLFFAPRTFFSHRDIVVLIPRGTTSSKIAELLKQEGVIRSQLGFELIVKLKGLEAKMQAGEYKFSTDLTPLEVLRKIVTGDNVKREVKILPCAKLQDLLDAIVRSGLANYEEVETSAFEPSIFRKFRIPYPSLEGYAIPDTYFFSRPISASEIFESLLTRLFRELEMRNIPDKAKKHNMTLHEVLTLASIIESEAKDQFERPLISSVYHNRLKRGMPLQADPTVAFGLKKSGADLTHEDLMTPNPYNTYLNKGLPPSPICFPSIESISAAVDPIPTNYIYFVSDGSGRHRFSVSYEEHLINVRKLRESQNVK
ncbi:MAG: endolytic transglycosylase MltG [Deltaproteobacteria bacterium]|nr:endolytic transglycosylase MltG [Deltaproteobacteria bacterium]